MSKNEVSGCHSLWTWFWLPTQPSFIVAEAGVAFRAITSSTPSCGNFWYIRGISCRHFWPPAHFGWSTYIAGCWTSSSYCCGPSYGIVSRSAWPCRPWVRSVPGHAAAWSGPGRLSCWRFAFIRGCNPVWRRLRHSRRLRWPGAQLLPSWLRHWPRCTHLSNCRSLEWLRRSRRPLYQRYLWSSLHCLVLSPST